MTGLAADAVRERLPEAARPHVEALLGALPIDLRLARPRRTRLGDHRGPTVSVPRHRISVNEDLNPYAFLTTLLHEIAHAVTWERHRRRCRRLRPHGVEWKAEFERIVRPFVAGDVLPRDVAAALGRAIIDPAAATCSDRHLAIVLARYDAAGRGGVFVETLRSGTVFRVEGGREFRLGPRLRSRFRCIERRTGREYRLHGLCRVVPLAPQE